MATSAPSQTSSSSRTRPSIDTRSFAAWAAILAVPTAIAGVYGMNFDVMPELHWKYGYFATIVVIALACLFLYTRFKRAGWL